MVGMGITGTIRNGMFGENWDITSHFSPLVPHFSTYVNHFFIYWILIVYMWSYTFLPIYICLQFPLVLVSMDVNRYVKGVVNCQNSRDKGPPEGNSARG